MSTNYDGNQVHDSDSGNALGLESIYFSVNSFKFSEKAKEILQRNARILISNKKIILHIEGHCDQKGSEEYNFKLGEQRARAVQNFLLSKGVHKNNLFIMSYGKGNLIDPGSTKASMEKNRRTNFSIASG